MSGERRGYIKLYQGSERDAVTILSESANFYTVRHETDWSDRKAGDVRRIAKQHIAILTQPAPRG